MNFIDRMAKYVALFLVVILIGAGGFVLLIRHQATTKPPIVANQTNTDKLQQTNADFNSGLTYQINGNYDLAIPYYQKALAQEASSTLSAQVEMYLGVSYQHTGDYNDAINLFKQMDAQWTNWPLMRAYAVEELANTYYYDVANQNITTQIFSTAPYSSFGPSSTTTVDEAYRNLFAYAANIYPLGIPETRVGEWYAYNLFKTLHEATTSPAGIKDLAMINSTLQYTDLDTQRIKSDPTSETDLPEILGREGVIKAYLTRMGINEALSAKENFQEASGYESASGEEPGVVEFYRAVGYYLIDPTDTTDIDSALSVFVPANSSKILPYVNYEFQAGETQLQPTHDWCVGLASVDPAFKEYLVSLGWQESNFSS